MKSVIIYALGALAACALAVMYVVAGSGDQFHKGLALIFAVIMFLLVLTLAYVLIKARVRRRAGGSAGAD